LSIGCLWHGNTDNQEKDDNEKYNYTENSDFVSHGFPFRWVLTWTPKGPLSYPKPPMQGKTEAALTV